MPKYKSKPVKQITVEAVQCSDALARTSLAVGTAAGDWLVTEPNGTQYFMSPADFEARFEPVEGSRKRAAAAVAEAE